MESEVDDINDSKPKIDFWKMPEFKPEDNPNPVIEKSKFTMLFPKYRETYFKDNWTQIKNQLDNHGVDCSIDYLKSQIEVSTTPKMWDPYIIIKARDMMKLICRSMSLEQAREILKEDKFCEIIKLNTNRLNKERFAKRRARLIGPDEKTLKCLEIICDCAVHIQGRTATVVGSTNSIKKMRAVINDCMSNVHPIYNIKSLMVRKEIENSENMKSESWDGLIPKYKPKKMKKKTKIIKKRENTSFPPPQMPSKIDIQLETGEYFLKEHERRERKLQNRLQKQKEKAQSRKNTKDGIYEPGDEKSFGSPSSEDEHISRKKIQKNIKDIKSKMRYPKKQ